MRRLPTALFALAAITPFAAAAFALHSIAMFEESRGMLSAGAGGRGAAAGRRKALHGPSSRRFGQER